MSPFRVSRDDRIALLKKEGELFLRIGSSGDDTAPTLPLVAVGSRQLVTAGAMDIRVVAPGDGRADTLTMTMSGMDMPARRVVE